MAETKWAMAWRFEKKKKTRHDEETDHKPKTQRNIANLVQG